MTKTQSIKRGEPSLDCSPYEFLCVTVSTIYSMKSSIRIAVTLASAVCVTFFILFICFCPEKDTASAEDNPCVLKIWQIDSFEGGKGSRAEYLQNVGNKFGKTENCYVSVTALSAEAVRLNLQSGLVPDLISYGAGFFGLERYISGFTSWCRGCYCLISLDCGTDFSDVAAGNTVINSGKDNFAGACALFCGLQGADCESGTSAYVKLINGKYKYLLGTQRDVFRLKTRNLSFIVKPITAFNDLYQNISVTVGCKNSQKAEKFINYLISAQDTLTKIGMLADGRTLYGDELKQLENISFEYRLTSPIGEQSRLKIETAISQGDINILKELFK